MMPEHLESLENLEKSYLNLLPYIEKKIPEYKSLFDKDIVEKNFFKRMIWYFCQMMLSPILFSSNFSRLFQKCVVSVYLLILTIFAYYFVIYLIIPTKTIDGMVYIYSIVFWIAFLAVILIFFNNFTKNGVSTVII
jgi:hypothetical protein